LAGYAALLEDMMAGFFKKLGREKLYRQWVDKEGLSPDNLPEELKKSKRASAEVADDSVDEVSPRREHGPGIRRKADDFSSVINTRFIFIIALIIMVLLVVVSVLATVLIMR
jgi:uncharacterized membrane protein